MLRTARASVGAIGYRVINRSNASAGMVKAGHRPALLRWLVGDGGEDELFEGRAADVA